MNKEIDCEPGDNLSGMSSTPISSSSSTSSDSSNNSVNNLATTMRHIVRIRLENFQSHLDTDIRLESGINLITGSSDAGKSAILRALNWVFYNKPNGSKFIRHGTTEARVTLWFSDGTTVQRIKGDTRNAVLIRKKDGKESAYDRFGSDYPEEVREALGHPPMDEKHGPLAYAAQHSPYFLLSLSATELPRTLAELTRIDDLQDAADMLAKRAREKDRFIKQSASRIDKYDLELGDYAGLDFELSQMENLEARASKIEKLSHNLKIAKDLLFRFKEIMTQGKNELNLKEQAIKLCSLTPQLNQSQVLAEETIKMRSLLKMAQTQDSEIKTIEEKLLRLNKLSNIELSNQVKDMKEVVARVEKMRKVSKEYIDIMKIGAQTKLERDTALERLNILEQSHAALKEKIVLAGLWCQYCQRPLDDIHNNNTHHEEANRG